jgi:hypothetical protein
MPAARPAAGWGGAGAGAREARATGEVTPLAPAPPPLWGLVERGGGIDGGRRRRGDGEERREVWIGLSLRYRTGPGRAGLKKIRNDMWLTYWAEAQPKCRLVEHTCCAFRCAVMLKLGIQLFIKVPLKKIIHQGFVNSVMKLVSTISFSVLVKRREHRFFPAIQRNLTTWSHLTVLLLAVEGLSCLLRRRGNENLSGIVVAPQAPPVNHFLFANSLLFQSKFEWG